MIIDDDNDFKVTHDKKDVVKMCEQPARNTRQRGIDSPMLTTLWEYHMNAVCATGDHISWMEVNFPNYIAPSPHHLQLVTHPTKSKTKNK